MTFARRDLTGPLDLLVVGTAVPFGRERPPSRFVFASGPTAHDVVVTDGAPNYRPDDA